MRVLAAAGVYLDCKKLELEEACACLCGMLERGELRNGLVAYCYSHCRGWRAPDRCRVRPMISKRPGPRTCLASPSPRIASAPRLEFAAHAAATWS